MLKLASEKYPWEYSSGEDSPCKLHVLLKILKNNSRNNIDNNKFLGQKFEKFVNFKFAK